MVQKLTRRHQVQQFSDDAHAYYVTIVRRQHWSSLSVRAPQASPLNTKSIALNTFDCVRLHAGDKLDSVINCHAPSSDKRKLTQTRHLSYFQAFHETSGADPFIWGGDFQTGRDTLSTLLEKVDERYIMNNDHISSAAQPEDMQAVFSRPMSFVHGDMALAYGLHAVQVNLQVGRSHNGVSDAHDLVIAKIRI